MKSLSEEEKRLPYRMRRAILENRISELEEEQRAAAQVLASEDVGGREAAAAFGGGVGARK